ncbi:precorrin-6A synthase (deacetylating) [Sphingobium sp. AR-3-1]|uniref:Precorrin-6A synthase [deacetylating] n=1 Tax=Sphingobium psychrophilum TaxID=2728834 RepID=A0A7X9ZS22_9SPHN|nr:precorrin-6A synthase (deacetylating) [Sphingobium psychrophilum]NML10600.1 precorrin-6A synthase (deacetylating) [Sphingobium psychrophilum]
MIDLALIGIGTGNPDHLTAQAVRAMNQADLILLPRKGDAKSDLIDLRRTICAQLLTAPVRVVEFDLPVRGAGGDYLGAVHDWHAAIAAVWQTQIATHLPHGGQLALLIWGDPSLYDSTLRIADRLMQAGMDVAVRMIPGITSIQALTAAHAMPLNRLGEPVTITTGRMLRAHGWPRDAGTLVVMLDGNCAFATLPPDGIAIWWGAYLGMAHEALIHGPLAQAGPRIAAERAALRARHGWIMDIYLMRKEQADAS